MWPPRWHSGTTTMAAGTLADRHASDRPGAHPSRPGSNGKLARLRGAPRPLELAFVKTDARFSTGRRAKRAAATAAANNDAYGAYPAADGSFQGAPPAKVGENHDAYGAYPAADGSFQGAPPGKVTGRRAKPAAQKAAENNDAYNAYPAGDGAFQGAPPTKAGSAPAPSSSFAHSVACS